MARDRITQIRISGLRAIESIALDLKGLTVLIGDNGTGKSSVLEGLELLRLASKPVNYVHDVLLGRHGGLRNLLRRGSKELVLGLTIEGAGPRIEYEFALANIGTAPAVVRERLDVFVNSSTLVLQAKPEPLHVVARAAGRTRIFEDGKNREVPVNDDSLALSAFGLGAQEAIRRVITVIEGIEVHIPFETRPGWLQSELDFRVGPRWPVMLDHARSLARGGLNLANCFHELRNLGNGETWERIRERARLGLGDDFRDILTPSVGRGQIELQVSFGSFSQPLPAESLSEGQLAYLAFIALVELGQGRSLLAFDEPEIHLHPELLARVVGMLEEAAEDSPVILATHSDRLLDSLSDPAGSVVLCELDERRATHLRRPSKERLDKWLEDYRGFGTLRAEGYQVRAFDELKGDA